MFIRLIDTFTLSLKSFLGNIPPYAILSHAWEDGEVSFQDMLAIGNDRYHPASEKAGYAKIVATCRQASRRGIGYAWVDTCCIDKTSSSELSEAINSMYQWYWNAEVCFALLADFDDTTTLGVGLPKCRWFTRGWCLQELIAPKAVEFYEKRWNCIGAKVDLTALLSSITNIDEQVLVDRSQVEMIPVGRKMSWAARRKTTRLEDIAYCLLGIFNVHMPMLYGEGSRAFMRLQEEITRTSNDLTLFAFPNLPQYDSHWSLAYGVSETYCNMFARSPDDFARCESLPIREVQLHRFPTHRYSKRTEVGRSL
ncbi:heterokaryon incompatibility protein-domain-containing protein [Phaeosphaeriaceae sp. PMI808]|nr:heterokaryon incompatibility protein-domain-containing protein [Phaeosphaeriaceae sp. PMI808]